MQYFAEPSSAHSAEKHEIVEIKLWGLYLLLSPGNLYNQIIEASLDHGPVEKNPQKPGRITFRFNVREWEGRVKKLLYSNRIPVIMKSAVSPRSNAFLSRQVVA